MPDISFKTLVRCLSMFCVKPLAFAASIFHPY